MATSVTDATSSTSTAAAQMKKSLGMNKDDFLKLFIAQLQHQDPLSPQDPTAMLGQLAQLTQVEQSYNTTTALENLLAAQNSNVAVGSVGLIGKDVVADGSELGFNGSGTVSVGYTTTVSLSSTTLTVTDASGKIVRTVNLGAKEAGSGSYQWDGKNDQGIVLPAGSYSFAVSGTNSAGKQQAAAVTATGTVDGVTFANGTAYLTIGGALVPFNAVTTVKTT